MGINSTLSRSAVVALLDEHERAIQHLLVLLAGWSDDKLQCTVPGAPNTTYRDVLQHLVFAAYISYFVWIQQVLGWEVTPPPVADRESITRLRTLAELRALLQDSTPYGRRALASLANHQLDSPYYQSTWNEPYTIGQMLEHAIVHVWRHLRQLERAEQAP